MRPKTALIFFPSLVFSLPPSDRLPLGDITRNELNSFTRLSKASSAFNPNDRPFSFLRSRALGNATQNDVLDGVCRDVTILFARGTTEEGNMGTLVGPPFTQAVGVAMGSDNIAVQGIEYPADVEGFFAGGDKGGSKLMAQMVGQVMATCPNTSLTISGYSQGGQLVHNAADMLTEEETAFVKSAVIFGDPNNGKPVGNIPTENTKVFCHDGDLICDGEAVIKEAHLNYVRDTTEAAAFVASKVNDGKA